MYKFIKDLKDIYTHNPRPPYREAHTPLSVSLKSNIDYLRSRYQNSSDFTVREMRFNGINGALIAIDNMVDKDILAFGVLRPIFEYEFSGSPEDCFNDIKYKILYTDEIADVCTYEEIETKIMSGLKASIK